jgi:hypothetical protein
VSYGFDDHVTESWDFTPKKATKNKIAEEEHLRYSKLFSKLLALCKGIPKETIVYIACEDAAGFQRGKSAVQTSHSYRGTVKCFAGLFGYTFLQLNPSDLKKFALKKGTADKTEMILAARKYGYQGVDDNEADSLHLFYWAKQYVQNK